MDPKELASQIIRIWFKQETTKGFEDLEDKILRQMVYAPIAEGETGVIAWQAPKTAALLFDRVWTGQADHVPEGIRFFNGTNEEQIVALSTAGAAALAELDKPETKVDPALHEQLKEFFTFMTQTGQALKERFHSAEQPFDSMTRILSESLRVPAHYVENRQRLPYGPGRHEVILSTITELQVVDESKITWEQVVEFRKDREARGKYRRLIHWLDKDMVGKSPEFIRDEVAERLEAYAFALKKHGIATVIGALSTLVKAEKLLVAAAAGTAVARLDPFAGLCVASGTLIASTAIEVAKSLLAVEEVKRGAEIAFVHDVKTRFGNSTQ